MCQLCESLSISVVSEILVSFNRTFRCNARHFVTLDSDAVSQIVEFETSLAPGLGLRSTPENSRIFESHGI